MNQTKLIKTNCKYGILDCKTGNLIIPCLRGKEDLSLLKKIKYAHKINEDILLLYNENLKSRLKKYIVGIYNQKSNSLFRVSKAYQNDYSLNGNLLLIESSGCYDSYLITEDLFTKAKYSDIYSYPYENTIELYENMSLTSLYDLKNNSFYDYTGYRDLFLAKDKNTFFNHCQENYEMKKFGKYNIRYHFVITDDQKEIVQTDVFPDDLSFFKTFKGAIHEYFKDQDKNLLGFSEPLSIPFYVVEGNICVLDDIETSSLKADYPLKKENNAKLKKNFQNPFFPFQKLKDQLGILLTFSYGELPIITDSISALDYSLDELEYRSGESELENSLLNTYENSSYLKEKYPKLVKKNNKR